MRSVNRGRFQDFFQGVAEQYSGGGEKIAHYHLPLSVFAFLHNITNLRPLFDILDTCSKKYIISIYTTAVGYHAMWDNKFFVGTLIFLDCLRQKNKQEKSKSQQKTCYPKLYTRQLYILIYSITTKNNNCEVLFNQNIEPLMYCSY